MGWMDSSQVVDGIQMDRYTKAYTMYNDLF